MLYPQTNAPDLLDGGEVAQVPHVLAAHRLRALWCGED